MSRLLSPNSDPKTVRAIRMTSRGPQLQTVAVSDPGPGEVAVSVRAVGLCRTDLNVLDGSLSVTIDDLVPGHEFSGVITRVGEGVETFTEDQRVTVNPVVACGTCAECVARRTHKCPHIKFMGLDLNGAFSDSVIVPAERVYGFPEALSFSEAAFAEPVAAVLAVADVDLPEHGNGIILGNNRIAELTQRVLTAMKGISPRIVGVEEARRMPEGSCDYVIESQLENDTVKLLPRLIRPRGTIVIKSRRFAPVEFSTQLLLPKEPIIRFAHYGPFDLAVRLLAERKVLVDDLVGSAFPLEHFAEAVHHARQSEIQKTFLTLEGN